jgi:hypothetical protein
MSQADGHILHIGIPYYSGKEHENYFHSVTKDWKLVTLVSKFDIFS